ncbi:uncharacterized protein LOC132029312 [Lycium ferocissimum]|uniref:uncharacterized protein LOC132029312 n=1 Tax=Lycium ferocissimum TaxID=112874 RepID=UPI002815823B|nr:uncharacterized protein LOC132029312 [Lycium ferocissimum]
MAKGGSMKGHMQSHNNGSRGRTYAVLVLLAFGVAIFGVLILHKLRERRIFNLLVKDRETELIDLKLLLQKEREHSKEAKRKAVEIKSKMQWLRTQKRDLESRIMEMKSTISSLKDEQRIIEVALEERQDEIKMLREKLTETNPEDSQVKVISESSQQKEAENDLPVKVWSVSADDPSNPRINFTTKAVGRIEATEGETEELHESIKTDDQKNSTENIHRNADESAPKLDQATRQNEDSNTGEQESQELRTVEEEVPGNGSTIVQTLDGKRETADSSKAGKNFLEEKRYDSGHASAETINHSGQVQNQSKEDGVVDATDWKEHGTEIEGDQGSFADSQSNRQESGRRYKSWVKLEMKDDHKSTDASRVKQEHIRKTKGKSRRVIAESKVTESDGNTAKRSILSMRNRKFFKEIQKSETNDTVGGSKLEKEEHKQEKSVDPDSMNESGSQDHRIDMTHKTQQFKDLEEKFGNQIRFQPEQKPDMRRQRMQDDSSNLDDASPCKTLPNPKKSAGSEEGIREGRQSDTNEMNGKGQEREANNSESEMAQSSQEVPTKTAASMINRVSKEARNKISDETTQLQVTGISRERQEQKQADNLHNSSEHEIIAERDVKADDLQVENHQETEEEVDQSSRISQEARYQKLNSTARAENENNTIFTDTEERLDGNIHSSSTRVKNAEMTSEDNNLDAENDKETEDEDHSKSSAANLEEEGKDMD